ncbi:MAG: hypothetical protein K6E76_04395 [Patescibacteria group bacterium]|nr:hypothetical protein [Patescibacteria group bacterium]
MFLKYFQSLVHRVLILFRTLVSLPNFAALSHHLVALTPLLAILAHKIAAVPTQAVAAHTAIDTTVKATSSRIIQAISHRNLALSSLSPPSAPVISL